MIVISRAYDESIMLNDDIEIGFHSRTWDKVALSVRCPEKTTIRYNDRITINGNHEDQLLLKIKNNKTLVLCR